MKTRNVFLSVLSLFSLPIFANELSADVTTAYERFQYQIGERGRRFEVLNEMQGRLDTMRTDIKCTQPYTVTSGKLNLNASQLADRIEKVADSFKRIESVRNLQTGKLENSFENARKSYYDRLQNLARTDSETLRQMNFKPEIKEDLRFMRTVRDLPPDKKHQAILSYEGRGFGAKLSDNDHIAKAQINGSKPSGETQVKVDGQERKFNVSAGQGIKLQTVTGAVVTGQVIGVMPNGNVVIANTWPDEGMKNLPQLGRGRIVDLNQAASVSIYADRTSQNATMQLHVRPVYTQLIAKGSVAQSGRPGPVTMTFQRQILDKTAAGVNINR